MMPGAPDGIVLPKVSFAREVAEVGRHLSLLERAAGSAPGATKLMAIVTETPQALFGLGEFAVAANPRPMPLACPESHPSTAHRVAGGCARGR